MAGARDAAPQITRQGKPSAFSVELVGKYSAFEEIDLADYLAVRDRAVRLIAAEDAYAALLISMHTYSLLSDHADRSTIARDQLPLLDQFLEQQKAFQQSLRLQITADPLFTAERHEAAVLDHFRLLQATDNLSLLTCVDFRRPSHCCIHYRYGMVDMPGWKCGLWDPASLSWIHIRFPILLSFIFPARHVKGSVFGSSLELQDAYASAPVETLSVTLRTS